jgi:hypothetical protein
MKEVLFDDRYVFGDGWVEHIATHFIGEQVCATAHGNGHGQVLEAWPPETSKLPHPPPPVNALNLWLQNPECTD